LSDPILNIVGELVALGPLRRDLLPTYQRWINDFGTARYVSNLPLPMSEETELKWFEAATTDQMSPAFTVYERGSGLPVGTTTLHNVNHCHGTAEWGIMIGEAVARGKGYGTETARLMLDYAFTALGLSNVMLAVLEVNVAGRRAYEKAGFREIGSRRQAHAVGRHRCDVIYMDCVSSEFESPLLHRVFALDDPRT